MKTGILVCKGTGKVKNIGDYLQSVAQEQFLPKNSESIERESLNSVEGNEFIKLIMNGWFMHHPENFPPSEIIQPLFLSFHITPKIADTFFSEKTIAYLKKYEPIGARDLGTLKLLESKGIKSWFSGCLTLTLGKKYKVSKHGDEIIFVDPYFELGGDNEAKKWVKLVKALLMFVKSPFKVLNLYKKFESDFISPVSKISKKKKLLLVASFYNAYSNIFSDDVLLNASYISHKISQADFPTNEEKMEYARLLIKRYSQAKYVVTSRIHCALPCLGIETPVLFVNSEALQGSGVRSSGRFEGLLDLLHQLNFTSGKIVVNSPEITTKLSEGKISRNLSFENRQDYKKLADDLSCRVTSFLEN